MEFAKDEIFNITYNTKLNRLEIKQKSLISRFNKFLKNHIIFSITIMSFIIFSIIDFLLIYNIINILENI